MTRSGLVPSAELATPTPIGTPEHPQPGCPHAPASHIAAAHALAAPSIAAQATAAPATSARAAATIAAPATAAQAGPPHAAATSHAATAPLAATAPHAATTPHAAAAPHAATARRAVTASRAGAVPRPAAPQDFAPAPAGHPEQLPLVQRQISHDIHHELGTIMVLASLLSIAPDVGADSRERARQILGEIRWLDELQRAYEALAVAPDAPALGGPLVPMRLDTLAADIVSAMQLSTLTRITLTATETWACTDRLGYWRALRNIIDNALRAAGGSGHVEVRISAVDGWAVAQVDDDGPGLGQVPPGLSSLGLGIVQDLASARGGQLEIRRGALGGCCVRLLLPAEVPGRTGPVG
jgi:signal transduction histidine kinase